MKLRIFCFLILFTFISYGQVTESFESWVDASYGATVTTTLASGQWSNNNSLLGSPSRTGSKSVRFNDDSGANEFLRYLGLDGNGKDNGIGDISFWYRHWDADGSNVSFQVQYSTDNGSNWINIGSVVNVTSTTYMQFSQTVNYNGDDILIQVISITDEERLSIDDFEITDYVIVTPEPEINITGNTLDIANNDTTPQTGDFTDFGQQDVASGSQVYSFVIENNGTMPLLLNGSPIVDIIGANPGDFTVTQPIITTIGVGLNTSFDITFNPLAVGTRTATVSIDNTDSDESPYLFDIIGEGTTPCIAPTNQATNLVFGTITSSSIDGSFTATTADNYLIIQSTSPSLSSTPIDGITYNPGDSLGGGTVIQSGATTSFTASGLSSTTTYYYFVFTYNNTNCIGGNTYNTTSPLINNETTLTGPCLAEDFTDTTFQPTGWLATGVNRSTSATDYNSAPAASIFNSNNGSLTTSEVTYPTNLTFYLGRTGNTSGKTLNINISTTSQTGPFTTVEVFNHSNVPSDSYSQYTVNLSAYTTNANVWIQFKKVSSTTSPWRLDDIEVNCGTACTSTQTITAFAPISGPSGTEITINGTGFTAGTTVDIGSESATIISQTATTIIAEIPTGASTNVITLTESGCALNSSSAFTVLTESGSCTSGPSFTDIFISEVTDASSGSLSYIEIYNGTGASIDLAANNYALRFKNNGGLETDLALTGVLNSGDSFIFATSVGAGCAAVPGADGSYADQTEVFSGVNNNDCISLLKNTIIIDVWGICDGSTWINALGLGGEGYDFQRKSTATAPNTTFNSSDWTIIDYDSCDDNYTDIETYDGSSTFPNVTLQPADVNTCSTSANFSITAIAGNSGTLSYQWYFNDGSSSTWTIANSTNLPLVTVSGETSINLQLTGSVSAYSGYQFYCLVTEDGTCSSASDASQLKSDSTTWDGFTWDNGTPTNSILAILDANYNTVTNGSIVACSLVINSSYILTVANNSYIQITNDIVNNGQLIVNDFGSVVQVDDAGTYTDSGSAAANPTIVEKSTAPTSAWYEYTFWSSPVQSATLSEALPLSSIYRRFWLKAQNYQDSFYETNNDNTQTAGAGIDNVDDNANAWQAGGNGMIMAPGMGFVATLSPGTFSGQGTYAHEFKDDLNTGTITTPVYRNDAELNDTNWNLVGNPYPSAINVDAFLTENRFDLNASGRIEGAVYIWSHSLPPSATVNGNYVLNFDVNDYAAINGSGEAAGGDNNGDNVVDALDIPNRFIPSCQSFLVTYSNTPASTSGNVTFTNSMRETGDNDQFFRNNSESVPNKFWLNLSNDFGLYNQILVSYVDGATNGNDGSYFDAKRHSIVMASMALYSTSNENELADKFLIQGRNPETLTLDEVVNLGYRSTIDAPTIYKFSLDKFQGDFLNTTNIYIKDKYTNQILNLKDEDYAFTSETGEFTDRFEIVFKSPQDNPIDTITETPTGNLTVFETNNNILSTNTNSDLKIESMTIFDTLGKLLFNKDSINSDTFNLNISDFSSAMYLVQIKLSNNKTTTKKIIKR
ncbi:choice-of-anchor D domain-containing protein [Aurantibacter sp.]|uniref:choice-of-anchor D domain-containing protein n=1 Tax=Aurantibacter sp. TaxID=2807103 RepID=UPI0035C87968